MSPKDNEGLMVNQEPSPGNVRGRASVLVCEIDKCGLDHALYNASTLATILLAYPEYQVEFLCEAAHWDAVAEMLRRHDAAGIDRIEHVPFDFASVRTRISDVARHELRWTRRVAGELGRSQRLTFILSITDSGLLALKYAMARGAIRGPVLATPHSILSRLALFQSPKLWRRYVNLRGVLRLPHPRGLRLIALSDSILANIRRHAPWAEKQFRVLEHTYFWERDELPKVNATPIRFGYFGVTSRNKGFGDFYRLAENFRRADRAEFHLVGFVRKEVDAREYGDAVLGIGYKPLDPEQFRSRAQDMTYAVWTGNPAHYELTASATFLDTLSYVTPGIFYRNAYVESYFERMGDIGYLCDSYDEMLASINAIAKQFPAERYATQCKNILAGRNIFNPAAQAPRLKQLVNEIAEDAQVRSSAFRRSGRR